MFIDQLTESKTGTIASSVVLLLVTYQVTRVIYNVYFHPLAKFPGPKYLAISPLCTWLTLNHGFQAEYENQLHQKYGSVVRVGPDTLSFITSQAWKDIAGFIPGKKQLKKDPIMFGRPKNGAYSIIDTPDDKDHGRQRRALAHAFSDQALREQEPLIKQYIDLLIDQLKKRSEDWNQEKVDLVQWYNFTTFDIIGDLALGSPFDALEKGVYHPWIATIFQGIKISRFIQLSNIYPVLRAVVRSLFSLFPSARRTKEAHDRFTNEKIDIRLNQGSDRKDFVSYILRHNDLSTHLAETEFRNNMSLAIVAGSETSATILSGLTYLLLTNPDKLEKLRAEIDSTFTAEEDISFVSTAKLPYLTAVIEEAFRVYPSVPQRVPRITDPAGNVIDGNFVAGGTSVAVGQYAAGRSPRNWHNPLKFVPERWTGECPPEYAAHDDKNALQPFSMGPRNCIGKNLAYNELRTIVARMFWNFNMQLMPESNDWTNQPSWFLWQKPPLFVKLSLRQATS